MAKATKIGLVVLLWLVSGAAFAANLAGQVVDMDKVNPNQAAQADFYALPGMTETLAKAIVDYRTKVGRFDTATDLLKVPGMTKEYLDRISSRIVILPEEEEIKLPKY